jgi:membrane peptidoglycan carboxypeptidase
MTSKSRRKFLALLTVSLAPSLRGSPSEGRQGASVLAGLPALPGEAVFRGGDSGGFVVYEARTLRPLYSGFDRFDLPERTAAASVAKTFCAYAVLRNALLTSDEVQLCDGDGYKPEGHGRVNVVEALALSCNTFFEKAGCRLTWEQFRESCRRLGNLDDRLSEKPASLLERLDVYAHGTRIATGFEELARLARAVALPPSDDAALAVVRRGWREAVTRGTAAAANVEGMEVAGKTGTLPDPPWERKFAAFAPLSAPRWVVAVRTTGQEGAAPAEIAGRVFRNLQAFENDAQPSAKKKANKPGK